MQQDSTIPQPGQNSVPSQPVFTTPPPQLQPQQTPQQKRSRREGWKEAIFTVLILLLAPLVALGLTAYVFQSYEVDGPSMQTTLDDHDRLIVLKAPRTWAKITNTDYIPNRGDVIVFAKKGLPEFGGTATTEKQIIKRVIGLPGDRVVVAEGKITLYNAQHPEGYSPDFPSAWQNAIITTPGNVDITVKEGEVFVSGDNRTNSLDSRVFGPVLADEIIGKLVLRVFPLSNAEVF